MDDADTVTRSAMIRRTEVPLDEVISNIGWGQFHFRLWIACGFGFAAGAIEVSLLGFIYPMLRSEWNVSEYQLGLMATFGSVGSTIGALLWGPVADHYGRRFVFMSTVVIVVVAGCASALSPTFAWLIVFRAVVAFGYGGSIAVDFALYSEFLPTKGRGRMLFMMTLFWPLGQVFTCLVAWSTISQFGWRAFLVFCTIPSLLVVFLRPFIPESPRWLLMHGHVDRATIVCREVAIANGKRPEDVGLWEDTRVCLGGNELETLRGSSTHTPLTLVGLVGRFLSDPALRRTTIGSFMFAAMLKFASYSADTLLPSLLVMKGFQERDRYVTLTAKALAQFPGIVATALFATHFGRVLPLQLCPLFVAVPLLLFGFAEGPTTVLCCICLSACFLEAGYSLFHVYVSEAYPTQLRATAYGVVTAFGNIISMSAPMVCAFLLESNANNMVPVIGFTAGICVVVFVGNLWFLHVETMDRDLQDHVTNKITAKSEHA